MARLKLRASDALIVVDVQNDFMPGGALPVPNALTIIPAINRYAELFNAVGALIVATRDWHPPNHISFTSRGGPWPPHCVRGTWGAEFPRELRLPPSAVVVSKAYEEDKEAYSGFEGTNLNEILRARGVRRIFVSGVATDYCVRATVLDAIRLGYTVFVLEDAVRGVDVPPGSERQAVEDMLAEGAIFVAINDIIP